MFLFFCGQGQIGSAPKSSVTARTKDYSPRNLHIVRLCPVCIQQKMHAVCMQPCICLAIFSLFCFVVPVLMTKTP